ncbi:putative toxin-antitoxin system toxin component, PIN family [Paracnuella aquatica]|uniref:putative toxin-antitoxin system toxin component, PIN family n=1 Tax=Paracnuella aquatica TaxID=2268757 RepID=UPI000DEF7881|nr:putative toxin-antitoxin system toxin component, PIN family [Paracnuella aquatica]RPD49051.1 putative toxin-antitoxin system toxin component, PIN family [Paracnuella aquatica]
MRSVKHRLIIDTNLWISLLLTKSSAKLDNVLFGGQVTLLFSQELLDEFLEVATRPKFKRYFSVTDLQQLLESIMQGAEFIAVTTIVAACRDPKDNFLLSLAKDGKATHLLTGDKDLLDLKKYGRTKILTITQYLESREAAGT